MISFEPFKTIKGSDFLGSGDFFSKVYAYSRAFAAKLFTFRKPLDLFLKSFGASETLVGGLAVPFLGEP